jgi:hypothetical protein
MMSDPALPGGACRKKYVPKRTVAPMVKASAPRRRTKPALQRW